MANPGESLCSGGRRNIAELPPFLRLTAGFGDPPYNSGPVNAGRRARPAPTEIAGSAEKMPNSNRPFST